MHPVLLSLGPITIYTYGAFIAFAFFLGLSFSAREAKKEGIDPEKVMDLGFYMLLSIIVGGRILFVLINIKEFIADPVSIFKVWEGGLVFYGGFIMTIFVVILYSKKYGINVWQMADIYAPAVALGQGIGRWGCFFAGCCYGRASNVPWAVVFTDPNSLAPLNVALHPAQLYDSLNNLIIFIILMFYRRKKKFNGHIFWSYTILYAIGRFIVEKFRGDDRGVLVPYVIFSTSQWIGLGIVAVSIFMLWRLSKHSKKCVH